MANAVLLFLLMASCAHFCAGQCDLQGDSSRCPLDSFSSDQLNLVLTGGQTRCLFDYSGPYGFQLKRGRPDRLLVYFDGGGACFNEGTTGFQRDGSWSSDAMACTPSIFPEEDIGVFSNDPRNAFRDFTITVSCFYIDPAITLWAMQYGHTACPLPTIHGT